MTTREDILSLVVDAMEDAASGMRYVRENYGDLSGVGFDRVQEKYLNVISKLRAAPTPPAAETPGQETDAFDLRGVREQSWSEGGGFWRSCSGCYETEDGHPVGRYPHSKAFNCDLGGGRRECGGIGAVWDTTDYDEAGRFIGVLRAAETAAKVHAAEAPGQEPMAYMGRGLLEDLNKPGVEYLNCCAYTKAGVWMLDEDQRVPVYTAPPTYADAEAKGFERGIETAADAVKRAGERVGSLETPAMRGDNLAICLCTHFDDGGDNDGDTGWSPAATDGYDEVMKAIRDHYAATIRSLASPAPKGET